MARWLFSKAFQDLPIGAVAEHAAALGFDGIDLTVRAGGHVEPSRIDADFASALRACFDAGVPVGMLTTSITSSDDADARLTFGAAAAAGVRFIKLGYEPYTFGLLAAQADAMRRRADGLATLASEIGVCACHHVHAGPFLNASAAVLAQVLEGHDPHHLAAYADPCHLWIEGARTGWRMGLERLGPHVRLLAIKDFRWPAGGSRHGDGRPDYVPLDEGTVDWPAVRIALDTLRLDVPCSFHGEYSHIAGDARAEALRRDLSHFTSAAPAAEVA